MHWRASNGKRGRQGERSQPSRATTLAASSCCHASLYRLLARCSLHSSPSLELSYTTVIDSICSWPQLADLRILAKSSHSVHGTLYNPQHISPLAPLAFVDLQSSLALCPPC
eukprot:scaffold158440_cov25-Tisochrysis_lutea.AAC.2